MLEAIATSTIADLLVWATAGMVATTMGLVAASYRTINRTERAVFGEGDHDEGVVEQLDEHERRIDAHEHLLVSEGYNVPIGDGTGDDAD